MSFLEGLAAFGGGFAEEALAVKTQQSNQLLKEQMIQLREAQLAQLMQKTTQAQQTSQDQGAIQSDPAYQALFGGAPTPSDPSAALSFASPVPAGGPQGGATGAAPVPPVSTGQPPSGALGGINQALQRGGQSTPPTTQVSPPGQPAGAAGAGMPAPSPIGGSTLGPGDPLAQSGQQLQAAGQARMQAGAQPQVPPGPGGAPSFAPGYQGASQPMQAKQVKTIPFGRGQDPGAAATQAPLPSDPTDPRRIPKGLKNLATPEQQAAAGITQPQPSPEQQQRQQAQKMAQAPEQTIMEIVKKHTRNPADLEKNYKGALKHYYDERSKQDIHDIHEIQKKSAADKAKKEKLHEGYIDSIVKAGKEGKLNSDDLKFYKDNLEVRAKMLDAGVDLNKMHRDTEKQKKIIQSIYSQRGVQFKGLLGRGEGEIQRVLALSDKLQLSGFGPYNRKYLEGYADDFQNTEKGQLVRSYLTAVSEVAETLAKLAVGGYAPTDSAWNQANKQIHEDFGVKAMHAAMDESLRFLNISKNVLDEIETTGTYKTPEQQKPQPETPAVARPQPGAVQDGYRFKGGNPGDKNNWEKVQ